MPSVRRPVAFAVAALSVLACARAPAGDRDATVAVEGTLRAGLVGIGGEHTGWLVERPGAPPVEVDVSAVRADAERLAGRRVRVVGRTVTRAYVERGPTPVLAAETIAPRP
jgi:hypothetical protein